MTLQWGYKRAFARCALLFAVGTALQIIFGDVDNSFLRYPWGLIIAINYFYLLVLIHFQTDRWPWLKRLYDGYAYISALATMVLMTIIFGLTRQDPATEGLVGLLGFSRMTSSWPFNTILLYFTSVVGLAVVDDLHHWRHRRLAALMSHLAVFVVLAAGIFGSGDKQRVSITTKVGHTVHVGLAEDGTQVALPFSLTLQEFTMDEYPPKLYILDTRAQSSSMDFLSVERKGAQAEIDGWHLEAVMSLDMAGYREQNNQWQAMEHIGAAPAVYVKARNLRSAEEFEGWVSCGSFVFEPSYLMLGERYAVAMPRREAKRYLSRVELREQSGEQHLFNIEVNHPARVGGWYIYQMGYDTQRGRWSEVSVLECVKDGWYAAVHIALWMMLAAGVVMFLTAGGRGVVKSKKEGER